MPGLKLLLRSTPFLVGLVAAGVWLRARRPERPQLPPPPEEARPGAPSGRFARETIDIVTVVDDLLDVGR